MDTASPHQNEKLFHTAHSHTGGGREHGAARGSDGTLDVKASIPGLGRPGTNPEQLLAAGWSACFEGALARVAGSWGIKLPGEPAIDAEIDLNPADDGFFPRARLNVGLPGLDPEIAAALVAAAENTCPYANALRGNVDVVFTVL